MAAAYRSDTGTLRADNVTGAQTISFVTTQPSAGDLVSAGGICYPSASSTVSVSDNQGNTYSLDVVRDLNGGTSFPTAQPYVFVHHDENVASSGTFTLSFNTNTSNSYYVCGGIAFSGVETTSALRATAAANTASASLTSQASGTTDTTPQAGDVAVSAFGYSGATILDPLACTGFTVTAISDSDISGGEGGLAYKLLGSGGAQSATWTFTLTNIDEHAAVIAVYKASGALIVPTIGPQWKALDFLDPGLSNTALRNVRAWW